MPLLDFLGCSGRGLRGSLSALQDCPGLAAGDGGCRVGDDAGSQRRGIAQIWWPGKARRCVRWRAYLHMSYVQDKRAPHTKVMARESDRRLMGAGHPCEMGRHYQARAASGIAPSVGERFPSCGVLGRRHSARKTETRDGGKKQAWPARVFDEEMLSTPGTRHARRQGGSMYSAACV